MPEPEGHNSITVNLIDNNTEMTDILNMFLKSLKQSLLIILQHEIIKPLGQMKKQKVSEST